VVTIGRPEVGKLGQLKAVSLAYPRALISHVTAAVLWDICDCEVARIHITVPSSQHPRAENLTPHRRDPMPAGTRWHGIPVTGVLETLIDLAATESDDLVDTAITEADKRNLLRVDVAQQRLVRMSPGRGTRKLAEILESHTVTDSKLEQRFLRIVRETGLPMPETQVRLNGFRVDFYWPNLGLVVETDGLTYHRTPAQQAKDRRRDQAHTAAGLTSLRFTNAQVVREPDVVAALLNRVAIRLGASVRNGSP
jgi:very-short-patch-repair endonuclease